jgi:hypothetical protein
MWWQMKICLHVSLVYSNILVYLIYRKAL